MKGKKDFDAVDTMRAIRDKADREISKMSKKELKDYFRKRSETFRLKYGKDAVAPHTKA